MESDKRKGRLIALCSATLLIASGVATTATAKEPPNVFLPGYAPADQQSNFLTFIGKYIPEDPVTARAYYNAIDPQGKKVRFTQWLVEAGFIGNENDWHPTGAQNVRTGQPAGVYGDNIINTDSHVIIINNADLGFVRNQFIRCKPSCSAKDAIVYSYLENYPVKTADPRGFPTQAEAAAAIRNAAQGRADRIADVAFDWAPASDGSSDKRYGQLYAYVFHKDSVTGAITETRNWFDDPPVLAQLNARGNDQFPPLHPIVAGDPFAPELDALGFKQHPGVCFACHGGSPMALTSTGTYPSKGRVSGFKFLPLDIPNLLFTSDADPGDPFSRAAQERQIKRYNQAVLITHGATPPTTAGGAWKVPVITDEQGVTRTTHAIETILGWYGGLRMPANTQNTEFVPAGWREQVHGGRAPAGSEELYLKAVAPSCRSCHFQRGIDADFGTVASFDANKSDILELTLKPECDSNNPPPGKRVMPLARRTFDLFWLQDQDELIKSHFGFTSTSYCSTHAE